MGFAKNALKAGGVAALTTFSICRFIPIVGGLVGLVVGGTTFLIVELGALTGLCIYGLGLGTYKLGSGVRNAVKNHWEHSREARREARREKEANALGDSIVGVKDIFGLEAKDAQRNLKDKDKAEKKLSDSKNIGEPGQKLSDKPCKEDKARSVSVTDFSIYKPVCSTGKENSDIQPVILIDISENKALQTLLRDQGALYEEEIIYEAKNSI